MLAVCSVLFVASVAVCCLWLSMCCLMFDACCLLAAYSYAFYRCVLSAVIACRIGACCVCVVWQCLCLLFGVWCLLCAV